MWSALGIQNTFSAQGQNHNTEIFLDFFTMFKITPIIQKSNDGGNCWQFAPK